MGMNPIGSVSTVQRNGDFSQISKPGMLISALKIIIGGK